MSPTSAAERITPTGANRRSLVKWAAMAGTGLAGAAAAQTPPKRPEQIAMGSASHGVGPLRKGMMGFTLAHEQFPVPELVQLGALASHSGFELLATSDHFQPWQANEAHAGQAWVTMGALGAQAPHAWMGTTVTCPTLRYNPAVVAEAFATLNHSVSGPRVPGRRLGRGAERAGGDRASGRNGKSAGTG